MPAKPKSEEALGERLSKLSPGARERVESALRTTIDAELAREVAGSPSAAGQFSRGIIFSRVTGLSAEDSLINEALEMDTEKFDTFAERLATLSKVKDLK